MQNRSFLLLKKWQKKIIRRLLKKLLESQAGKVWDKIIKLKDEKETKDRLVKFVRMNVEDSKKPSNTIGNMLKELKNEIQKNRSINKNKAKFMQNLISAMEEKNKQKVLEAIGEDQ